MEYFIHKIFQEVEKMSTIKSMGVASNTLIFNMEEELIDIIESLTFKIDIDNKTNFYFLNKGCLVFDEAVYDSDLITSFDYSSSIIELKMEEDLKLYLADINYCGSFLDIGKSELGETYSDGEKQVLQHTFHFNRFEGINSLFKLPENTSRAIYCTNYAAEHSFFDDYNETKFTGLDFIELAKFRL